VLAAYIIRAIMKAVRIFETSVDFYQTAKRNVLRQPSSYFLRWDLKSHYINTDIKKIGYEVKFWIHLAHNSVRWRALVNAVLKFIFPRKVRTFMAS
jgi:hypothetical protein